MRLYLLITTLWITVFLSGTTWAQDTIPLSRMQLSEKWKSQNLQLKMSQKEVESARSDYRQSNALFLPFVSASHTAITTTNPLMAFGSKLNQQIITMADFNPALLNNPNQVQNYATKIEVLQPLINVDGWQERKAAKAKMEAFELQSQRTEEYLQWEIDKAFTQLQLAYQAVEVMKKAQATAQKNLRLVDNYYAQGMLQKTDVLNVQVRVGEVTNQLRYAQSNIKNASDYLAFMLNEDHNGAIYMPSETLTRNIQPETVDLTLPASRKDLVAMEKSTQAYENMMKSEKLNFLPRLNAFGVYEMYDTQLFQFGATGYTLGAQLSWDVFDGYKSIGKMEKAKAEFQKATYENEQYHMQSQLEVNKIARQLSDAENNVALSALAFEQTQEAYRIRQNRFEQGLEKTSDLLQSETSMAQKELEWLQAIFEYQTTQSYLQFLTK
ncbi:MAG: TolC family protein [Flavobacterium sp.]